MKVMELTRRIVSTATLPLQLAIHPLDTAQKGVETLKQTGYSVLRNVQTTVPFLRHVIPLKPTELDTNGVNPPTTVDNHVVATETTENGLVESVFILVTRPIKTFLYENNVEVKTDGAPAWYDVLTIVANLVQHLVLYIFAPELLQNATKETNQAEIVNKSDNKTENSTKLYRDKRETESKTTINHTTERHKKIEEAAVCDVCGFESQNACATATNTRGEFECERVQYKSEIDSILKKIRSLEQDNGSESKSKIPKTDKKSKRGKKTVSNL